MLESKDLVKAYGKKLAVDHVSLRLEPQHIYALLGPNGSGKTTWMKMAASLIIPTSGQMLYQGTPVGVKSRSEIAYMATEPYFYTWMSVRDVGRYYRDFFPDFSPEAYRSLLARMELTEELKVKQLSSGMAAKLKIAATMARKAKVYLLDEPFNGIDLLARDEMMKCILESASENAILLLSSHLVEEMESVADTAIFMKDGKLVEMRTLEDMRSQDGCSMADRYRAIYGHTQEAVQ